MTSIFSAWRGDNRGLGAPRQVAAERQHHNTIAVEDSFSYQASLRGTGRREDWLVTDSFPATANHQAGAPHALAGQLLVLRMPVTDANHAARAVRLIDVRAVDGVNVEADHVPGLCRNSDGVLQVISVRRQVRRAATAVRILGDVLERVTFVRGVHKPDFTISVTGVVHVDEHVYVPIVSVFIKCPVLVHRERMPGFRRLDVHRAMVKFHPRSQ